MRSLTGKAGTCMIEIQKVHSAPCSSQTRSYEDQVWARTRATVSHGSRLVSSWETAATKALTRVLKERLMGRKGRRMEGGSKEGHLKLETLLTSNLQVELRQVLWRLVCKITNLQRRQSAAQKSHTTNTYCENYFQVHILIKGGYLLYYLVHNTRVYKPTTERNQPRPAHGK